MKSFGLIGASGYIAPRHMKAIKENECNLVAAIDPFDSVGIIDSYFPESSFFTEIERFDRYVDRHRKTSDKIDYISICSPNYLHDSHIRLALRNDCNAICEKPLVIKPKNLKYLKALEEETGKRVYGILQLRHHPAILQVKDEYKKSKKKIDINLTYITSRGQWYFRSWKGDALKSGGLAVNIGIHFFDMLIWIFGDVIENIVLDKTKRSINGVLRLERANITWTLSVDESKLPKDVVAAGHRAYRNIVIDGKSLNFSDGFTDLHTIAYKEILNGNGFGINDTEPALRVVTKISEWKG